MSYYRSNKLLADWADNNLKHYLDPREYEPLFRRLNETKKSKRLSRIDIGLLKLTLEKHRPERTDRESVRYAESAAISRTEIADILVCNISTVNRARNRINSLTSTRVSPHGLIIFHDLGYCIQPTLWDAIRARAYSQLQGASQLDTHVANVGRAEDHIGREQKRDLAQKKLDKFNALTPEQKAKLLETLSID